MSYFTPHSAIKIFVLILKHELFDTSCVGEIDWFALHKNKFCVCFCKTVPDVIWNDNSLISHIYINSNTEWKEFGTTFFNVFVR